MSTSHVSMADSPEEWIPLAAKSEHPPRKIRRESRFKVGFLVIAPIFGYICLAIATATVLISVIHRHHFHISETNDFFASQGGRLTFLPFDGLRQSDVTTLISLASTLTRFLGGVCCGIACWRAVYILLEREGLSLADIDSLVSFSLLRPWPWSRQRILLSAIALLFLSSELYSPILNGSVAWTAAMSPNPNKQVLTGLTAPSRYYSVSVVPSTAQVRLEHDMVAYITAASSAKGDSNSNNAYSPELWRIERRTSDLPINSTLANITLPFFAIDSFEWITDPEQTLDSSVLSALDLESTLLNFAGEYHPLYASSWGYVALIPNRSWNATFPSPILSFPSKIVIGAYHVLITVGDGADVPCEEGIGQLFEYLPPTVKMLRLPQPNAWCLAFAHVSIRTGAGTCRDCRVAAPLVVRNQSTIEPEPDNMAEAALYVMPEVSTLLSQLNVTQVSPRNGLEQYIRETLTLHYCGTWNVLALRTVLGLFLETMVKTYVQVSEATVNRPRVIAWLVLNVCVAACCGAIAFVQASTGRRRVVVDSTLASVLLDATEVVNGLRRRKVDPHGEGEEEEGEGGREISNMSILLDDEKQTRVKLIDGDDINEAYARFKLVPDTRSSG